MEVLYRSTRGQGGEVKASQAILKGLADDGGLFVPEYFPKVFQKLKEKASISYEELSFEIIKEFFDDIMDVVTMLGGELNDAF